ncbi:unnamed protein product [Arctia plantaginis]|uniref:Uncharacterized protein n=1 Tax=Arctia plantaginis TaxID=874455 RepID=A0A8S1AL74_ARCPL|nr:unnamed protein product [Arctia plantaginis]
MKEWYRFYNFEKRFRILPLVNILKTISRRLYADLPTRPGQVDILLKVMAPRQDLVAQPQPIRIEQGRQPPPPPAPGRHQRPPHDNPTVYINSPVVAMPRNNVSRREITRT